MASSSRSSSSRQRKQRRAQPAVVSPSGYVQGSLKWAITAAASLGAILEVIDTSIVNVALNDMQASLGATVSEIGWVVSGYAIANVVLIPLSAWLGDQFGTKRYFIFSLIGFTLSSVLCGLSVNLPMMVLARILQGLCGGGLLAKAQAILFSTFPPAEQGVAQAVFGLGVIMGPAIGPTLGGYLVDGLGWRWIFFVNIPFGILAVMMSLFALPNDSKKTTPNHAVDWWGIALLVIAVGSLQTLLEEGETDGWFSSSFITVLAVSSVLGLGLFIWRELTARNPAVDLRVLRHRSLAAGSVFSGILGMGLYGATFAVPLFAQSVLHFTATQTGLLLAPSALASGVMMIVLGKISNKFDPRFLIAIGVVGISWAMFQLSGLTPQTGESDLFMPLIWRGVFIIPMYLPLSLAALGSLPKDEISAGSGFYNLTRQLGGSVGIAVITTVLDQRETFHRDILLSKLTPSSLETSDRLNLLTGLFQSRGMDAQMAHQQALTVLSQTVDLQSAVLSYADTFRIVGIVFLCSLPLLLLLGKGNRGAQVPVGH